MTEESLGEKNYEQFSERYAQYAINKPHNAYLDRPAVLSLLPDLAGKRVLDAGCGPGFYAEAFLDRGATVVSFDVTPAMVAIAQARVGDRATVLLADMEEPLDFARAAEFDLVVAPLCLDYIRDWGPTFAEFYRVLKPGGVLVFSAGHPVMDLIIAREVGKGEDYHQTELFTMVWGGFGEPKPVITSYRRPLAAMINPLLAAGFRLDHLLEPLPTDDYRDVDPDGYDRYSREPSFLCVRAVK